MLCYRKRSRTELKEMPWDRWLSSPVPKVEEKLIALNSCYGFVTRYSVPGGQKQTLRYPKHVKGHITVFPNNVQELVTKVLPHPLLQVMDEIHISWQGAVKPTPSDLSSLLSVRRRVVERALVWLKRNNPHYAEIEIDAAEMESWGESAHGVPPSVYGRLERNEPSAWEKTRTAHIVPPTERAMDDEGAVEIEEVLSLLNQGRKRDDSRGRRARVNRGRRGRGTADIREREAATRELVSSRNMSLRTWADTVLRRHGGRFATHHIFAFLVFNIGVRSRNRRVSMLSVTRKNFRKVERIRAGKTTDDAVKELLRSLSLYGVPRARPEAAEEFLRSLDKAFKRVRLSVSDPMSSAVFFHREMTLFFEHYVNAGNGGEQAAYRERIVRYVDSVFSEDLDQEGFCAVEAERSVTSDISSLLNRADQFSASKGRKGADLCRFKAPWERVEETTLSADGVLRIRRTHPMVNRWNKAIAVGLRHNHDISFIATQRKTMALVYYVTNYATKVEDPTWKRVAAAAELLPVVSAGSQPGAGDDTRQFLMRVANRVFTERALSAWAYLNVSVLYWHVSRLWRHLRQQSGTAAVEDVSVADESVVVEQAGERISFAEAYHHRGHVLRGLCLYDYVSLVRLQRVGKAGCSGGWGEVPFESGWVAGKDWVQVLRRPGKYAVVCLDGYLSKDFEQDDEESAHRSAAGANQITAGSRELSGMIQQLCRFQQSALASTAELEASIVRERGGRRIDLPGRVFSGAAVPPQDQVKAIKSQQTSASRERVKMIQGIQSMATAHGTDRGAAERSVLTGFGEEGVQITAAEAEETAGNAEAGMEVRLGPSTSFLEAGKGLTRRLTLNRKQAIALSIICRHLDLMRRGDGGGDVSQLCQFVGGEGGTGKSRVIEALAERFVDGESRMDWQDKEVLVIDEVSMLGARTLHAVNERLCQLRGSQRDFGGIPIVLFCGDFHQFRPVQERSILLPSSAVSWDEDYSFRAEQRHQHDKAHALWKRFTTVVMLDEQMRAAGDPELQRLLKRIRLGVQDHTDLDLLNSRCYREGRRIPWETGITVVTPLNRNRWNLNMEASLAFQMQRRLTIRIFISEHKWKEGLPTEEEAIMMLNQGDDSATPVPGVFIYTAAEVIVDKVHPAHRISADMAIHFGPPAAIILGSETTKDFHFVGMPPGTILLTPMSVRIQCHRKRPWQQKEVTRKGLPCAAAFACTDYKVQGGTLERVALELRGTRTTNVGGHGIMLISEVRERL
ncbi:PIF1-like helicase [Hirsutella rhossiliensis]|uniref:ATP-dependent DNA helicase n=1 Tax=Hirsutella rhossiliensis TaxID=111463 RepID=A0A9P8SHC2_9HYPO|nr:PIF1-like helicase domain-containing protein [Hirsutella rhossiliensis]KAH0962014.1 PIF1-like helicase domain-containing protein [Hirsutella rhossiliensis]